jgi:hypothetical protein
LDRTLVGEAEANAGDAPANYDSRGSGRWLFSLEEEEEARRRWYMCAQRWCRRALLASVRLPLRGVLNVLEGGNPYSWTSLGSEVKHRGRSYCGPRAGPWDGEQKKLRSLESTPEAPAWVAGPGGCIFFFFFRSFCPCFFRFVFIVVYLFSVLFPFVFTRKKARALLRFDCIILCAKAIGSRLENRMPK